MTSSFDADDPLELRFTAAELRAAMHLVDPKSIKPDSYFEDAAAASSESPWLLPLRLVVAPTVVSERFGRIADASLLRMPNAEREEFQQERHLLARVARGELAAPGLGP